jgi:hypothetical protein
MSPALSVVEGQGEFHRQTPQARYLIGRRNLLHSKLPRFSWQYGAMMIRNRQSP